MVDLRGDVYQLAIFLHKRQHKSKRIAMCQSDVNLATDIIDLLRIASLPEKPVTDPK